MSCSITGFAALAALVLAPLVRSAELPLPEEGWASWEIPAIDDAPAFCCWSSWDRRVRKTTACDLDSDSHGYGTHDDARTSAVRIYARFRNGEVERLRTLAAACPVKAGTPVRELDGVATDDSVRWILSLANRNDLDHEVPTAIAVHRGEVAFNALRALAREDARPEMRKQALFWQAVVRGAAGAEVVSTALFADQDADVRKQATFALTQSRSPRVAADLIRAGTSDASGAVRAQAWFWLAHSGAQEAERAISAALLNDRDAGVREQAIAALARLPDDRATKALIAAAEDRSLSRELRKRALFWLAQSETEGAQRYLDKVLLGAAR